MSRDFNIQRTQNRFATIDGIALVRYSFIERIVGQGAPKQEPWLHAAGRITFNKPEGIGKQFLLVYVWDTREVVGIAPLRELLSSLRDKFTPRTVPADNLQPLKMTEKVKQFIISEFGQRGWRDVEGQLNFVNSCMQKENKAMQNKQSIK